MEEKELKELVSTEIAAVITDKMNPLMADITARLGKLDENKLNKLGNDKDLAHVERTVKFFKAVVRGDAVEAKDLSEGTNAAGGYLVPLEFQAEVIRVIPMYGVARKNCRIIPMGAKSKTIPKLTAGVSTYWTSEKGTKGQTTPSFGLVTLTAQKLAGICPTTEELLEDSAIDIYNLLVELFAEAFAKEEDTQLFRGSGSPITGIFNASGVNSVELTDKSILLMTADDLLDMVSAVEDFSEKNGKFYLNRTVLNVLRKLKDTTTGQYVFQAPTAGAPGTIWGYPYEKVQVLPGTGDDAVSTKFLVFGDLKYVLFGDRRGMTVDIFKQGMIGTTNLITQDMQAIRVVERLDMQVAVAGAFAYGITAAS